MTAPVWPDPQSLLDGLSEYMESEGQRMQVARHDDFLAGLERARLAYDYTPDATLADLAALIFDGIATRHPLVDGNKRLAWVSAVSFLILNGVYLDAPERASYAIGMAVIAKEKTVEDLAAFFTEHSTPIEA